jgi:pimeloyl-ACP methyl ester carboxylesterase
MFNVSSSGRGILAIGLAAGAALAATALLLRRSARRAEMRHPATGRFVELDGVRLHYIERGEGEPVVLLHGNGTYARDFIGCGLMDQLAQRYRVIAFDRPGFGYSERPRLKLWTPQAQGRLLENAFARLGIDRPVVVAHSWATEVALAMAQNNPHALRGLLLVSGYYYPTPKLDAVLASPPAIPLLGDIMRYTVVPLFSRLMMPLMLRRVFSPRPVPDAFKQAVPTGMMLRPWQLRAAAADSAIMVPAAATLARHYSQMDLPVTIVAGDGDCIANPRTHSERLHRALPGSKLLIIPNAGHMLHYAVPEQLGLAVDDLFARAEPAAEEARAGVTAP